MEQIMSENLPPTLKSNPEMEAAALQLADACKRSTRKHITGRDELLVNIVKEAGGRLPPRLSSAESMDRLLERNVKYAQDAFLLQCRLENPDLFLPTSQNANWKSNLNATCRGLMNRYIAEIAQKHDLPIAPQTDFLKSASQGTQR